VKKPYNIELSTERNQPVDTNIKLCQGDNNITFYINISDFDLTGNTVKIVFSQSNGISVENNAIVNSDKKSCTYNIVGNELQSPGKVIADLKIFDSNNKRLSSACFIFYVEIDSLNDGAFPPKSYSASLEKAIEECQEATQAALEAVQKVVNIANNDSVTEPGFAWDARRGKAIRDDLNTLNESLAKRILPVILYNGDESVLNNYSANLNAKTSYEFELACATAHPVIGGGSYKVYGYKTDTGFETQQLISYEINNVRLFYRCKFNGAWQNFIEFETRNGTNYLNGTHDLNTFKNSGRYTIGTLTNVANAPTTGSLTIDNCGVYIRQTIFNYGVETPPKMFVRTSTDSGATWKPWYVWTGVAV